MREAKKKYGLRQKDFHSIRRLSGFWTYDWSTLAKYMLETCGSKMEWVRVLAKRDIQQKKSLDTRSQNRQMSALLRSMAPGFEAYVRTIRFTTTDEKILEQCNRRFIALKAELIRRRLPLRADSRPCKNFIKTGGGSVQDVVVTMEQEVDSPRR
ncbi:hypothetical protein PHYPSEUDO_012367 [Phytophthora pseudosyringae]|uniref:Uncharacterized protein n=1 Tax=Phytophthora pseudosyringae TaxID=221518 RepID=A0A8T1V6Q1_9STRA|nr:hypothetical protein PHYPSEUDO_012367 [Phytophthora pseudosyringae]